MNSNWRHARQTLLYYLSSLKLFIFFLLIYDNKGNIYLFPHLLVMHQSKSFMIKNPLFILDIKNWTYSRLYVFIWGVKYLNAWNNRVRFIQIVWNLLSIIVYVYAIFTVSLKLFNVLYIIISINLHKSSIWACTPLTTPSPDFE